MPSGVSTGSTSAAQAALAATNTGSTKNKKWNQMLRKGAGKFWVDSSLDDWPKDDFRIFCGDLGNEVTDDLLANAFRKYASFQKAKVIRDKRTGKTKGFGFVSFGAPEDMVEALRNVDNKYVGNRPIRLKKSAWREKNVDSESSARIVDFNYCRPQYSKSILKFKKLKSKIRQDPERQKARARARQEAEEAAAQYAKRKR